ncbi:MAG: hypothetical protein Hals2KO_40550 [Halioglobus sp.]
MDSNTNDPVREAVDNNTLATAQPLPNPVTLGGYVNLPGAGAEGRSSISGDLDDFFLIDLLAGQRITVLVGDYLEADADLYLYNAEGEIVDSSLDVGEVESLLVEEDGSYIVNVAAFSGATNYILAIGSPELTALEHSGGNIVPWQAIVRYRDEQVGSSGPRSGGLATTALSLDYGMSQRAGERGRNRLMAMQSNVTDARQLRRRLGSAIRKRAALVDSEERVRWETLLTIKSLRADPRVQSAEPNYRLHTLAVPNDEAYPLQWHYPLIGLPEAWETTNGDQDVIVAVVDTGILPGHPDLLGQLVPGYDFVRDTENSVDGDGLDPDPSDPGNDIGGTSSFHGTHVSGTVAARGNNGRGVAGVAYGSRIMPLRALGFDGGTTYDVEQAIRFAAGLANDSGTVPTQAADIVNLSLGGAPFSQSTQSLLQQVRGNGVIIVAASGNEGSIQPSYPAAYDGVISVSAVDTQRRITNYSNTGPRIDVAAPGGNSGVDLTGDGYPDGVLSTSGDVGGGSLTYVYSFSSGTSMAAPHVAGVLALMKSINPDLTPDDVDSMLVAGSLTEDLGPDGRDDEFGHGLIDANRAVIAALESIGSTPAEIPRLVASVNSLNFGAATTELTLSLRNGGLGALQLNSVTASASWLTITADDVDNNGLGEYSVSVNRSNIEAGVYSADITADSSVNTVNIRVFMSVGGADFASDVGVLYVLLYDPVADEPVDQWVSSGSQGVYPFRFENVAPGEYEIVAGSDADNDLLICDAGESCGAYLTIDQPVRINIDNDLQGLDFAAEYVVSLPNIAADSDTTGLRTEGATSDTRSFQRPNVRSAQGE